FRSQHSHREGRRLLDLSRRRRSDASDAAGGAVDHGLVPRLPSPSRNRNSSTRQGLRHEVDAAKKPDRGRASSHERISYRYGPPHGLFKVSPMKPGLSGAKPDDFLRFSRRDALRIFAAHMALAVAGCSKPVEEIVPYVQMPQGLVPGEPLRFAMAIPMAGYGLGIMGFSVDGRPI